MDPESFICSASVLSYERRGRETWYIILIVPRQEPCYTIHRRYQDFLRMSNQLTDAFPHYNARRKNYQSCFPCAVSAKISPPTPPPIKRSFKDHYTHHYHRAISTCSPLPRLSSSTLLAPSSSSSSGFSCTCTDYRFFANRKRRLKQLDRYLYEIFRMPLEVHQSSFVFEFLNYQPFLSLPLDKLKRPQSEHTPIPKPSISCPLFPCRYSKSLPPTPTSLCDTDIIQTPPLIQEPSDDDNEDEDEDENDEQDEDDDNENDDNDNDNDNDPALLLHETNPNSVITLSLYLGPGTFVSTTCTRQNITLELIHRQLNTCLETQGLEPLPSSSVLAYNHIATSDRQGALETLTLNQKEPWIAYDQVMHFALSHRIAFFATTLPGRKWKYNKKLSGAKVLLISCEKDLQAAIHGKWRRLDHVTLSCLAW